MPLKGTYDVRIVDGDAGSGGGGGMRFEFGEGAPDDGLGQPGDVYLDTDSGDFYQNQNGDWNQIGNLQGPAGSDGSDGEQGPQGEQGPPGETQFTDDQVDALLALIDDEDDES